MHSEFQSVSDYLKAVEAEVQDPSPIEADYDFTVRWGADVYRLWRSEWRRERPFEASIRMMLEWKARRYTKYGCKHPHLGETHLFELFGIDWAASQEACELTTPANKVR
jgi:hypothetical protein